MFKSRVLSTGLIVTMLLALVLNSGALAKGQNSLSETSIIDLAEQAERDGIQRAWACDGKGNVYELTPESGQIEFMDRGTSRAEFMAKHAMLPEEEAKIVHRTPPCPVVIDGTLYEPEQIHLFDGQQLGFTVGNDGRLYAFTTDKGLDSFVQAQRSQLQGKQNTMLLIQSTYSQFWENTYYTGSYILAPTGSTLSDLSNLGFNFNDMISSEEIGSAVPDADLYADINYQGDYFRRSGYWVWATLSTYGWNDRASSLIVWWF